jgi:hypothetical protein
MEGEKMAQAIDAAAYVLDNLGPDDRLAVVDFSRYIRTFDEKLRPAEMPRPASNMSGTSSRAATRTSPAPSSEAWSSSTASVPATSSS